MMFLDSSAIIELLRGEDRALVDRITELIKDELLFISIVQVGEVHDWCLANSGNPAKRISQLLDIVHVIPLNEEICIRASEIKSQMRAQKVGKFSLMDGFILASARHIEQRLLTLDSDFRKADDAIMIR